MYTEFLGTLTLIEVIGKLLKRRGWPETANTWEPVENLFSCSDIIDSFEDRFSSSFHFLLLCNSPSPPTFNFEYSICHWNKF